MSITIKEVTGHGFEEREITITLVESGARGPQGVAGVDGIFTAKATQADAEVGTDDTKGMTPQKVHQAIAARTPTYNNWIDVTTVDELEAAIAAKETAIYLLAGADYVLTQPIVPYDGLTLRGERLPSTLSNSKSDGVLITIPAAATFAPIGYDTTAAGEIAHTELTIAAGAAGDTTIDITAGLIQTIMGGSVIKFDNMSYVVMDDAVPVAGAAIVKLSHQIFRDHGGPTTIYEYTKPLRDFTIQNINIWDRDESGCRLYAAIDINIINCAAAGGNYLLMFLFISVAAVVIRGGHCALRLYYSSGPRVSDLHSDGSGGGRVTLTYCAYSVISNCRGVDVNVTLSRYFEVRNSHAVLSMSYSGSAFFTVDSCSADNFNCSSGDSFTVSNCAARNIGSEVLLAFATNYQFYGNRWQAAV